MTSPVENRWLQSLSESHVPPISNPKFSIILLYYFFVYEL